MLKEKRSINILSVFFAALFLSLLSGHDLLSTQINDHMDSIQYITSLTQFDENIRQGIFFPQWAPDLLRGNGQPLFIFLPPGFYWIAEFFHLLGLQKTLSINLTLLTAIIFAAFGVYIWCRRWVGELCALVATCSYIFAPYFLVNLYVRGAYGEFMTFASMPWILWAIDGIFFEKKKAIYNLVLIFSFASIFLFHNGISLIFTPFVLLYLLVFWITGSVSSKIVGRVCLFLFFGASIAAFFWVPAILLKDQVSTHRLLHGYLHYQNHLVYLSQIFYSQWGYDILLPGRQDGMTQKLGEFLILAALYVFLYFGWRVFYKGESFKELLARDKKATWSLILFLGVLYGCFFASYYSKFIWDKVQLLQYLQFGMRFFTVATLCGAALVGVLASFIFSFFRTTIVHLTLVLVFLGSIVGFNIKGAPKKYIYGDKEYSPLKISQGGYTANNKDEFKPRNVLIEDHYREDEIRSLTGKIEVYSQVRKPLRSTIELEVKSEISKVIASRTCFKGWVVRVNDHSMAYDCNNPFGQIEVVLPRGKHRLELQFEGIRERNTWGIYSFFMVLISLLTAFSLNKSNF